MSFATKESSSIPNVPQFWFEAEYQKAAQILQSESDLSAAKKIIYDHARDSLKGTHHEFFFHIEGTRSPILPFKLDIKDNRLYGFGDWYTDAINATEHDGATKQTAQRIEEFITNAPIGALAFFISPAGPAGGLKDESGQPIIYKDSAVYILQRSGTDQIQAWNIFTDQSILECERLVSTYNQNNFDTSLNLEDRMKNVVGQPVFLNHNSPQDVVDSIQQAMGSTHIKPGISFEQTKWLLNNPEILESAWKNSTDIQILLQNFENLIAAASDSTLLMATLRRELPELVLKISAVTRGINPNTADLESEAQYVSSLNGCTTSGGSLTDIMGYRDIYGASIDPFIAAGGTYNHMRYVETPWGYLLCKPKSVQACPHSFCGKQYYGRVLNVGFRCECRQIFWGIC